MTRNVYFNEYNIPMDDTIYLPFASGLLKAYAKTFSDIKDNYTFMPTIYERDTPWNLMQKYKNPYLAAFSVSLWNYELSLEMAKRIKKRFPLCIIVFGGPSAPFDKLPPNVDFVINGEGEKKFADILLAYIGKEKDDLTSDNLDIYPSPYLNGEYDSLLKQDKKFQIIIETNRGCPFQCSYCFWGHGGLSKKFKFHSLEYIKQEAEWAGKNKIEYVFCADSNFGMFKRDIKIAQIYADTKAKYGYPHKFRVCYGKNAEESIYSTAMVLSQAGLAKAITLSKQSDNNAALANVGRKNISKNVFESLQKRYSEKGIPTYSEFILGLPGETITSFKQGIIEALKTNTKIFIYHCTVLPNTEMANPEYIKKHGIKTVRVPMSEIHCKVRKQDSIIEYEDIIIETNTMSKIEWIECAVNAWIIQLKYGFGINPVSNKDVCYFYEIAKGITEGKPRGQIDKKFGDIYWEPEELVFLRRKCVGNPKEFAKQNILYGRKDKKKI